MSAAHTLAAFDLGDALAAFLFAHFVTLVGFLLALLIAGRLFTERRSPSNIYAWLLVIVFLPEIGVPLYFLFGGRKSRHLVRIKKQVSRLAMGILEDEKPDSQHDRHVHHPRLTEGNDFHLLPDGQATYRELCKGIEEAEHSIWIMTYIFSDDAAGRPVLELLTRRAREGLDVKVLVDALGSWGFDRRPTRKFREAGGHIVPFMRMLPIHTKTSANLRNHRKAALFDHSRAIVGGQNIDVRFMGPVPNRDQFVDFSALLEGPIVKHLNAMFIADWCFAAKENPHNYAKVLSAELPFAGNFEMVSVLSGPDFQNDPLWEHLISRTQEAHEEILIVTPYFIPDDVLFNSLLIKARSGRRVRLILPRKSNQRMVDFARGHYLRRLQEAGAQIHLYTEGMVHAKLLILDGKIAFMGSANLDMRSLFLNFEVALVQTSTQPVHELYNYAETLLANCVDFSETRQGVAGQNSRLVEDFAHLLVPLL